MGLPGLGYCVVRSMHTLRTRTNGRLFTCLFIIHHFNFVTLLICFFFFQAEDGIRDLTVTGVQTCALPIYHRRADPVRCPSRRRRARGGPPGRHLGVRAAQTSVGPPGRRRRARRRGGERRHWRRLQRPRGLPVEPERCRFQPADHPQRPAIRGRQSRCQPGPRLLRGRRGAGCGGGWSPLVGPAGRLHRSDHPLLTTAGNLLPGNRRASVETVAFARRNVVSRSAAICLLLLASAACRNNDPDPRFQQASAIYQQLYATQLDDAYADPRMDEVVALLGKVSPRSIDAERAQAMLRTIQKGRVELAKERADREKMAAAAAPRLATAQVNLDTSQMLAAS